MTRPAPREPGALVLGLGFSGVGALHALQELRPRPRPIIGADSNPRQVGFASRVGPILLAPAPWEDDGRSLRDFLLRISEREGTEFVLLPCGDDYVRFVSSHRESLSPAFRFSMPEPETVDLLLDKSRFADLARLLGIDVPAHALVTAEPGMSFPEPIRFPIVAKAVTSLRSDPFWGIIRVKRFDDQVAWDDFFHDNPARGARLMIQELVPGGDEAQQVYEGFWSERSEEVCGFTARKLRQEPAIYGSSSRAVCEFDAEVQETSELLLRTVHYQGLVDIDYKRDARDGRLRAMEVNPRLGGIHRVGRRLGIELVQTAYLSAAGRQVRVVRQDRARRAHWCHLSKDLRGFLPQLLHAPGRLWPWVRSYWPPPIDALFSIRDPGPWLLGFWHLLRSILRGLRRGLVGRRRPSAATRPASAEAMGSLENDHTQWGA